MWNNKEALKGLEAEELEDELEEREMKEDPDYEGLDGDDETFTLVSKHKKHKKLVRRNRIESEISEESIKENFFVLELFINLFSALLKVYKLSEDNSNFISYSLSLSSSPFFSSFSLSFSILNISFNLYISKIIL